jgi:polar amino acid transport system permease protein
MTSSPSSSGAQSASASASTDAEVAVRERPEPIKAVPVRHPGRWVAVVVVAVIAAMFVHLLIVNPAFNWSFMLNHMFRTPIVNGVKTSLIMTVLSMVIGVVLGVVAAVMRLSPNPILSGAAFLYTWFFRAVPRLVLLILFGNLGILYSRFEFGIPFDRQLGHLFGIDFDGRFAGIEARSLLTGFMAGLIGLALSEGAYMAEIVRAGIQSVDPGQAEAAQALGLSRGQIMRRIVLPQAMRVIIPPTGNETIAMLKDTSLLAFVPVTSELFFQLEAVGSRTFQVFPLLVAACLWYLSLTSVLMVAQYFLERHFGRGFGAQNTPAGLRARLMAVTAGHGKGGTG